MATPEADRPDLDESQRRLHAAFSLGGDQELGRGIPRYREIPRPLGVRARAILDAYELAAQPVAASMSSVVRLGLGYGEREALFRYHGVEDHDTQEFLLQVFEVIGSARAEGRRAGEEEAEKLRKQEQA